MSEEKNTQIKELCEKFRSAKIQSDKFDEITDKCKTELKEFALTNNLDKGNLYGVKIIKKFTFLPSNIKIAEKNNIKVPLSKTVTLNLSETRIKELIKKGILKEDEVSIEEIPNLKELEKIFSEEKIVGEYKLDYAFGLSAE